MSFSNGAIGTALVEDAFNAFWNHGRLLAGRMIQYFHVPAMERASSL